MVKTAQHFDPEELVSQQLTFHRDTVRFILESALTDQDTFISLASKNKTIVDDFSFTDLLKWLNKASKEIYDKTGRYLWTHQQAKNKFYITMPHRGRPKKLDLKKINFYRLQDLQDALQLVAEVERRSPDLQDKLVVRLTSSPKQPKSKPSRLKKTLEINGTSAVEFDFRRHHNLNEPLVDMSVKVNNPIGRLWRAIKRLWKNQKTTVALRLTIPLLVLPIFLYFGYRLWQGRGVNQPVSKLGIIHQTKLNHQDQDIFILPTADVYILKYGPDFKKSKRILEQPVIVIGTLNSFTNTLTIADLIPYDPQLRLPINSDSTPTAPAAIRQLWDNSWNFFQYFK